MTTGVCKWVLLGVCAVVWINGPVAAEQSLTPRQQMAQRLARLARQRLAGEKQPTAEQIADARKLLEQAATLDPASVELAALRVEAESLVQKPNIPNTPDAPEVTEARRQALANYLRANPTDDAAQLRLIALLADSAQDAPARAAMYQRMLQGPAAEKLSAPLRSRVAMRAALLAGEQGQTREYAELIQQAIRLDSTNARAAAEAYLLLRERGASNVDQAQALFALLAADPTNPTVHLQIASMLLHAGAYEQAINWFESTSALWRYHGAPQDAAMVGALSEWALALVGAGRYDDAAALIQSLRAGNPKAELPVGLGSVLVAAHDLSGKTESADKAFASLIQRLDMAAGQDPDSTERRIDNVWARLLYNRQIDKLDGPFEQLNARLKADDPVLRRLTGWRLMRQGKAEQAAKVLEPLAETDPSAALALAISNPQGAEAASRSSQFNAVYQRAPGNMIGVLAAYHVRKLGGRPQPTDSSLTIQRLAQQVPETLQRIAQQPESFVRLELEPVEDRPAYGQPAQLRLTLTNVSPVALSLAAPGGGSGTIPGTALILVTASAPDGKPRPAGPLVVNLARRLRLDPGQSVRATVRIDSPVFAIAPNQALVIRATAVLNPVLTQQGQYSPGLLGVISRSQTLLRPGMDITDSAIAQRLASLKSNTPGADFSTLAALPVLSLMLPKQSDQIVTELTAAYGRLDPVSRAWLISGLPAVPGDPRFEPLQKAAAADKDPLVQSVLSAR